MTLSPGERRRSTKLPFSRGDVKTAALVLNSAGVSEDNKLARRVSTLTGFVSEASFPHSRRAASAAHLLLLDVKKLQLQFTNRAKLGHGRDCPESLSFIDPSTLPRPRPVSCSELLLERNANVTVVEEDATLQTPYHKEHGSQIVGQGHSRAKAGPWNGDGMSTLAYWIISTRKSQPFTSLGL
ncbi:hypothetical protein AOLI_G00071320 [Acnodon oligacanthus]